MKLLKRAATLAGQLAFDFAWDDSASSVQTAGRKRFILHEGNIIEYELKRSKRRTIGFVIDADGLTVTAPRWVTLADVEAAVHEKARWILAKTAEWQARRERQRVPTHWGHGTQVPYMGGQLQLALGAPRTAASPHDNTLHLALPPAAPAQQIRDTVQAWLQAQARQVFAERLGIFAERMRLRYQRLRLSSAATRWGSCNINGTISLNWRLIHFSLDVIDYVVAHELAHLKEMNHSPRFWAEVAQVLPGFETARAVLRQHDPQALPAF
jgi:predicted metal-dependent hydrolase